MHIYIKAFITLIFAISLAACGGGGGSSSSGTSSGGGTPAPVATDTLSLSTGAINFSATQFEPAPETVSVTATITGSNTAGIVFGTLPGVDGLPFWLDIQLGNLVNNSVDAVFRITTTDLPDGPNEFTVRAVTFDANEAVLDTADIVISFDVEEGIPLSVSPESVDVLMHFASDPISQVISVTSGEYEWSAFSSDANLDIGTATGSQDVTLSIFPPMQGLVDGNGFYQGAVDILQNGTTNNSIFLIDFTIVPTLENLGNDVFLNAIAAEADGGSIGVNLKGQGLNWAASADMPWLSFSAESGIIETDDLSVESPGGDDFTVFVDGSTLTAGRHTATITVTADAEQTLEIPVTIEVAPQIVMSSKHGIAFSATPAGSSLEAVVDISTNANRLAGWTASSNVIWLTVTPSGTVGEDLVITADPAVLANETTSEAIVTLSSSDAEISNSIDIHVGLWKSASNPSDTPVAVGGMFPEDLIVADPVRPLAYVHSSETEINIVHVYTGAIEKTFNPTERVFNFDVSDDGAFLYLVRSGEGEGFVDVVDLDTQEIITTFTYPLDRLAARDTQNIRFGRIANAPYLFIATPSNMNAAINAVTGETQPIFNKFPSSLQVRNNIFCGDTADTVQPEFGCLELVTAGFEGARITSVAFATGETIGGRLLLTQNADRLYAVDERIVSVYDTSDLSLIATIDTPPEDFVEAAELDSRDNLHVTYRNDGFVPTEIGADMIDPSRTLRVFGPDLAELRMVSYPAQSGILPLAPAFALSGDDHRIVYLQETNEGTLAVNFLSLEE